MSELKRSAEQYLHSGDPSEFVRSVVGIATKANESMSAPAWAATGDLGEMLNDPIASLVRFRQSLATTESPCAHLVDVERQIEHLQVAREHGGIEHVLQAARAIDRILSSGVAGTSFSEIDFDYRLMDGAVENECAAIADERQSSSAKVRCESSAARQTRRLREMTSQRFRSFCLELEGMLPNATREIAAYREVVDSQVESIDCLAKIVSVDDSLLARAAELCVRLGLSDSLQLRRLREYVAASKQPELPRLTGAANEV